MYVTYTEDREFGVVQARVDRSVVNFNIPNSLFLRYSEGTYFTTPAGSMFYFTVQGYIDVYIRHYDLTIITYPVKIEGDYNLEVQRGRLTKF